MFEQLVLVDHPNIVKLHKYWLDVKDSKARVGRPQGDRVPGGPPGWGRELGGVPALLLSPWDSPSFPGHCCQQPVPSPAWGQRWPCPAGPAGSLGS